MRQLNDFLNRLEYSRRGFGVDNADHFGRAHLVKRIFHLIGRKNRAPRAFENVNFRAHALGHLAHSVGEISGDANQNFIAPFDQIAQTGFHSRCAAAGDRARNLVLGFENSSQHRADIGHDLDKFRIEMAQRIRAHRAERFGIRSRRPRAHQHARRDFNFGNGFNGKLRFGAATVEVRSTRIRHGNASWKLDEYSTASIGV